jgi:putative PEP-CTERM system TPR-repeat lipoprotein
MANVKTRPSIARRTATWCLLAAAALAAGCGGDDPAKLVASAKGYIAKQDAPAAIIQLKNALQKEPANAEARFLLGTQLMETGDAASAEKEFRRALEHGYRPAAAVPELAKAMLQAGQAKELVAEFSGRRLDDPAAQAALATEIGIAHFALGQTKEAGTAFAAALAAKPGEPRARIGAARVMAANRDLAGAMKVADEVLAQAPGHAEALALKADVLLARGEREPARRVLADFVNAQPKNVQARFALVSLLLEENRLDEAKPALDAMRQAAPRDPRTSYLDALLAFKQGEHAKAKEAILETLKSAPNYLPARVLAGSIELALGQLVAAEDNLRRVVAAAPQTTQPRVLLAVTYLRQGQPAKAEETLAPALKAEPDNPRVLQIAGEIALARGDVGRASEHYQRASAADKDNARLRTRLAQTRFAAGDANQGFRELESAAAVDPGQYQADVALVLAHAQRREYDKALEAVDRLEKKQPDNPVTFDLRGRVLLAKGDRKGARASFEKAVALKFDYLAAVRALAALDVADKQPDAARRRYEAVLAKAPSNEGALLGLAELLATAKAPTQEIAAAIERAVKANPASVNSRLALIGYLAQTKDAKGALAAAQAARAAIPNDPRILDALGLAQLAAGETNQAIATFNALVALQPDSAAPLLRLARAQVIAKDYDASIATLRKATALRPDQVGLQGDIAVVQLAAGRPEEALKEARALQAARPKGGAGFALEGELLAQQKKFAEAAGLYAEALKREAQPATAMRLHGLLLAANKPADASKVAATWLREHPKDVAMRMYLADTDLRRKDLPAAARGYREVLAIQPENVIALNNLAWVLGETKDPGALALAEKAYALAPASPAIADTLGWILVERGDAKRGTELLGKAAAGMPNSLDIRLRYAKGLIKTGDKARARTELEAVAAAPGESAAKAEAAALLKQL